ncbi:expressed unknown protein [Seminavis robusta]|uniref:DUF4460 domain-containing protein n=1 Tax=Seminavis robusta TaxID=568900 RepID=A0A9N8EYH9_9STRA|nr:expressed unknown protein [Seminavis robusta]|eukprot:Sro2496_g329340.1 n/a (484) ;mRNA; f:10291-11742
MSSKQCLWLTVKATTSRIARRRAPLVGSLFGSHHVSVGGTSSVWGEFLHAERNGWSQYRSLSSSSSQANFSSAEEELTDASAVSTGNKFAPSFTSAMRSMVKPFFMKVHPDTQTSPTAKQVNLVAIQNLNAFLDSVQAKLKPGARLQRNETTIFHVDFCVMMEERVRGKKEEILCRRTVELSLPRKQVLEAIVMAPTTTTTRNNNKDKARHAFQGHVESQLIKLLHVAGLTAPNSKPYQEQTTLEEDIQHAWSKAVQEGEDPSSHISHAKIRFARQQKYERNRDEFVSKIDWNRYEEIYKETVRDVHADMATDGLIRDDPQRRMAHIAEILSKVRVAEEEEKEQQPTNDDDKVEGVDPIMQLVAIRRLSLLLDEHFDDLQLENLGRMWESTVITLMPARSFNTAATALYKRRKRQTKGDVMANDGFAIALHHDNSVTIHIPVDFRDEELLSHLRRHVKDYASLMSLGLDDFFPRSASNANEFL